MLQVSVVRDRLTMVYYFAYGSNMDEMKMKKRVGHYKIFGKGILDKYALLFNKPARDGNGEGFANVIPAKDSKVEGIIYEISEEGIKKLDLAEGVPSHYNNRILPILHNKKIIECNVYIATNPQDGLKPKKAYLEQLLNGKKFLSTKYFNFLKNIETLD